MAHVEGSRLQRLPKGVRFLLVLALLCGFLVAVKLMENSIKLVGAEAADQLFEGIRNPFAGLAAGILATVLVQSSSVTTSIIVGIVGSGRLDIATAVPMVMGANIGTSMTNTIVSIGHITRSAEFRRAFAGATMHDIFNLMTVAILLPLEVATGFLQHLATSCAGLFDFGGVSYKSPISKFIKGIAGEIQSWILGTGLDGWPASIAMVIVALALIIAALTFLTKIMRSLMADRVESALNRVLGRSGLLAMGVGVLITAAVQSSSITTSLLVPLIGAGIITLEVGFPLTLGANVGTTITALLAVMAAEKTGAAMTVALTHLFFNLSGILLIYPFPPIRRIPLRIARGLATLASRNRVFIAIYVIVLFVLIPLGGILLFQ